MVTSLWGAVQVTLRAGFPELIALDTATTVTWDGTIKRNKGLTLQMHTITDTYNKCYMYKYMSKEVTYSYEWDLPLYAFTVTVVLSQQYCPVPIALTPAT